MSIEPGQTLLHYRVVDKLGEGGMGVVWRAVDTTLDREVAIKLLPDSFSGDAERRARFEREAKLLASLNHPGIATIHGLHQWESTAFLAMELVPGEDLAARLSRGSVSIEESLRYAVQIAEALEAAHQSGIVHRDLKPANVVLTPEGKVKVLDFGLAKVQAKTDPGADPSQSPTMTAASQAGMIMGTAGYMAPEQARGEPVDHRADLWALGVVLFEMLTGKPLFRGPTVSDSLAMVLQRDPDWGDLPARTPRPLRRLLKRALMKDARQRLQSAGDARIELEEILTEPDADPEPAPGRQRVLPWLLIPLVALGVWWLRPAEAPSATSAVRSQILLPEGTRLLHEHRSGFSISPDGARVAFVAGEVQDPDAEQREPKRIWLRSLDQWQARPIAGTEGGVGPVFSPDGRWLLFSNRSGLHKVDLTGGEPVPLCECRRIYGAAWGPDGTVAFSSSSGPVMSVSSQGGEVTPLTQLDPSLGERRHELTQFLPGGRVLLLTAIRNWYRDWSDAQIVAWSLDGGERTVLVENGSNPRYVAGHLLFAREGDLLAAPFDLEKLELTGEPVPVLRGVNHSVYTPSYRRENGVAQFDLSDDGTLVYAAGSVYPESETSVYWVDRDGAAEKIDLEPRRFFTARLSPGGGELLLTTHYPPYAAWIHDLERGTLVRQTLEGMTQYAIWGPGEENITFHSNRDGPINLYTKRANTNSGVRRLMERPHDQRPGSWSPDGKAVAYVETHRDRQHVMIQVEGAAEPVQFDPSGAAATYPYFSPDGAWLAYGAGHTGRHEVYIRPYPGPGDAVLVSTNGGSAPAWSHDGSELFYRQGDAMWAVPLTVKEGRILPGRPVRLFDESPYGGAIPVRSYDVSPDGRFIMIGPKENEDELRRSVVPDRLRVVQGWVAELGLR